MNWSRGGAVSVYLNVYDLVPNNWGHSWGFGLYHTGEPSFCLPWGALSSELVWLVLTIQGCGVHGVHSVRRRPRGGDDGPG